MNKIINKVKDFPWTFATLVYSGDYMDDRIGNLKSQIEHLRGGLDAFDGETDTQLKQAIAALEKAMYDLERAIDEKEHRWAVKTSK